MSIMSENMIMFSDIISYKALMNIPLALIQKTEMFKLMPTDCKILNFGCGISHKNQAI